jgi:hypothetical protein
VTIADAIPDVEYAAKKWTQTAVPSVSGRVFFAVPASRVIDGQVIAPTMPLVALSLVGGTTDTVAGIEYPRLSWRVWGRTKKEASDGRRELITALQRIQGVLLDEGCWCSEANTIVSLWLPDDEAKLASYVVDATLVVYSV